MKDLLPHPRIESVTEKSGNKFFYFVAYVLTPVGKRPKFGKPYKTEAGARKDLARYLDTNK